MSCSEFYQKGKLQESVNRITSSLVVFFFMKESICVFRYIFLNDYLHRNIWNEGLPRWLSCKEFACQCRRCGFDRWVRKSSWRMKWQPTPVFLPGESHGQRSLVGYSPWGSRVRHDWASKQHKLEWHILSQWFSNWASIRITWKACSNTGYWARSTGLLIQQVWGGT